MKREEACDKLYEWIQDINLTSSDILYKLETEIGMKPPCSCHDDPERTEEKGYGPRCGISWHLHEWSEK